MRFLKQSTSVVVQFGPFVDKTDGVALETGLATAPAGQPVELQEANDNTVVIFTRGSGKQPGPEVIAAPGHVAFLVSWDDDTVTVLGGNQGDKVSIKTYPRRRILGVRRLRRG